jgi:hypothetical protein
LELTVGQDTYLVICYLMPFEKSRYINKEGQ